MTEGELEAGSVAPPEGQELISPTEDELYDAAFEADVEGGDEPPEDEPESQDDEDGPEESSEDETADEPEEESKPQGTRVQREAEWMLAVAADPTAIRNVPRKARRTILAGAEAAKAAGWQMAQQIAPHLAAQMGQQTMRMAEEVTRLNELFETDPAAFREAFAEADDRIANAWTQMQRQRRGEQSPQPQQPAQQPQLPPDQEEFQVRARGLLAELKDEGGEEAVARVNQWAVEEGLTATPADFQKLKARVDKELGRSRNGTPPHVERRRSLPKPDVSPGRSGNTGRLTAREAMQQSESQVWEAALS